MLAHKEEEKGNYGSWNIGGQTPYYYNLIPGVVYTWPEVAVGQTEEQLKALE
jgi:pyruvate/2-oxoglutarate dehydrogenase complex dihydrolipoamide dehydrogenase (E3) component